MIVVTVMLASMHSWYSIAFEPPVIKDINSLQIDAPKEINLLHFIAQGCSCSENLVEHLVKRKKKF